MAGTLNISLSQQVDGNGTPLAGALLYFYQVGTVATPQNSYQDYGLTFANPNPIVADQNGRIPMFYLADGQVHVRLTDASGVVIFDYPNMQVIGPSSGGGGGGGSVDPTTVFATGDFKWRPTSEVLSGWVAANSLTIGSSTSGATQRANVDTQNLFVYLWNNFSNTFCPVTGGRGASGLADFSANKTIQLPDMRGRSPFGLDDMGNTASGRITTANDFGLGNPTTPGSSGGEGTHTLINAEMSSHSHSMTVNDPSHAHNDQASNNSINVNIGGATLVPVFGSTATSNSSTGIGVSAANTGGGGAHNNMPPFKLGTWYLKL